eukprot:342810-Pyramimonas_sp.AAC.2
MQELVWPAEGLFNAGRPGPLPAGHWIIAATGWPYAQGDPDIPIGSSSRGWGPLRPLRGRGRRAQISRGRRLWAMDVSRMFVLGFVLASNFLSCLRRRIAQLCARDEIVVSCFAGVVSRQR